ncbi:MAG TPA: YhgE/Pip family protein [Dermatophilaceae bacterium]|nr:YhgE/Pip family protein [Dermatophilaceae bacterium]
MTALRLALTELRRLTSGRLPRLALVAMLFVPTLYGGLYLYANKDPYAGLSRVPAAIVVEDAGTTLANGERLQAGPTVARDLVASRSFDWHEVGRGEATSGVADGRYDFALIVPRAFSGDLASSTEPTPRQAHLQVATNDANNYIAHTIANQVVAQVTKSVAEQVSSTAANQLLLGAAMASAGAGVAAASGQYIASTTTGTGDLATALGQQGFTQSQISTILAETARLSGPAAAANAKAAGSSTQVAALAAGATRVAAGAHRLALAAGPLQEGIHQAAGGAARLRDGADSLASGVGLLGSGAASIATGQRSALDGVTKLDTGAGQLKAGLGSLSTGASTLHTGLATGRRSIPNPSDAGRKAMAQTIGNPVGVTSTSQATAGSYGAGLAPFFLSLALWIGAYVLFLLVKPLSSRALAAGQPSWRIALGGWLPPALFGLGQGVLAFAVVFFGLGIHVEHPAAVLALMSFTSIAFVAILHALVARLGAVGKFLGLVLMVVQLVSAGGTFPWQTLPMPLNALHHVLPMGYAVDGIRRLMYGGSFVSVGGDLAVLSAYLLLALTVSTFAARRARVWTSARVKPELVL